MNPKLKITLAKILALVGLAALWAPILFMFLTAIVGSIISKTLLFDYLMLAELYFIVIPGLVVLFFSSLFAGRYQKCFGWGGAIAVLLLVGAMALAALSGLASGAIPSAGAPFIIVIAAIIAFNVLVVALAVLSILLVKKLFQKQAQTPSESEQLVPPTL